MTKKQLSERDICTKFITPALEHAGGDVTTQVNQSWGVKIIDWLAHDSLTAFPYMKGFSPRNLKYKRAFVEAWPKPEFVQEVLAQFLWHHQSDLARESLKDPYRFDFLGLTDEVRDREVEAQSRAQSNEILMLLSGADASANELANKLELQSRTGAFKRTLQELLNKKLVAYTIPDKPNSRLQKYRLIDKGRARLQQEGGNECRK